jgi:hypothetical protein
MNARRALAISIVAIIVVIAGCSSSAPSASGPASSSASPSGQPSPSGQLTRTSDGGQVTVVVDWAGPSAGAVFHVTLDTHAVDLDPLDLTDAVLRNDRGETLAARPWSAPKGGHHRQGTLAFQGDTGPFLANTQWIELVIQDVGDLPERVLRWELGT